MKIYNFNKATGEYLGSCNATANPMSAGEFLIPASATAKKPKKDKDGFAQLFQNNEWIYTADNRNVTAYNKSTADKVSIDYLGDLKDDVTLLEPEQFDVWDGDNDCWTTNITKEKEHYLGELTKFIDGEKSQITGNSSSSEMISWSFKRNIANAIVENSASDVELDVLQTEADLRGEQLDVLVQKIITKNDAYLKAQALLSGFNKKAKLAINDAVDVASVYSNLIEFYNSQK